MKANDNAIQSLLEISQWLHQSIATGYVTGLSLVLVDESDGFPVPRHVFFSLPHATAALAGGYVVAQHEMAKALSTTPTAEPPRTEPVPGYDPALGGAPPIPGTLDGNGTFTPLPEGMQFEDLPPGEENANPAVTFDLGPPNTRKPN